jgi:hypothetical protein
MAGLVKGKTVGIDATTLEANAALRSIVRRDTGEGYEEFLTRLAKASGISTPTRADLARIDRKRKKKGSNDDWMHPHDPDAKIAKMKDGRTHLAHKAEHAIDLETGATVGSRCKMRTSPTRAITAARQSTIWRHSRSAPTAASPIAGHSRGLIKTPNGMQCTRIAGVSEAPAANGSCAACPSGPLGGVRDRLRRVVEPHTRRDRPALASERPSDASKTLDE